jgi:hypothetical protein
MKQGYGAVNFSFWTVHKLSYRSITGVTLLLFATCALIGNVSTVIRGIFYFFKKLILYVSAFIFFVNEMYCNF